MKKSYSPLYFISQAIKGLWRNGVMSAASIAVLMSCLVVMGGFSLLVVNFDVILEHLGLMNQIVAFTDFDADAEQITKIDSELQALDNVKSVTHVTKEESLDDMKNQSEEYKDLFSDLSGENNPLSDYFVVEYNDVDQSSELAYQIKNIEGIRKINHRQDLATKLENLKSGVLMVFVWFLAILLVVSVFIIVNTIKLSVFARRHEITVMRYVGATGTFITLPFLIEGVILGTISGIAGYFIEWYVYHYVENMVQNGSLSMISVLSYSDIGGTVLAGFLVVGILTGIIGSVVWLGKYLKV